MKKKVLIWVITVPFLVFVCYSIYHKRRFNLDFHANSCVGNFDSFLNQLPECKNSLILNYEGYSCGYDTIAYTSRWVFYKLKKDYISVKKKYKNRVYKKPPEINSCKYDLNKIYKYSGFDRGHLARQADLKGRSRKCEVEGCYFTNIVPQLPHFNRKTWLNLENAIWSWVKERDSLWIMTGPVFRKDTDFLKQCLPIPSAFYKIILSIDENIITSQAFLIPHSSSSLDLSKYIVSIDSIERLVNINFFEGIPDQIENILEYGEPPVWRGYRAQ